MFVAVYHRKCSRNIHSALQIEDTTANAGRIQGGNMLSLHIVCTSCHLDIYGHAGLLKHKGRYDPLSLSIARRDKKI